MAKIVSVHSFRGGTGKSNTTANVSAILAGRGLRVGVVDTDIQSPGIHVLFGLDEGTVKNSLNDYLWEKCGIADTAHDVTAQLGGDVPGAVYLIPSSIKAGEIARVLREGYNVGILNDGFQDLIRQLNLDILLVDTHPGLNQETLLSIAISDSLLILMRPDQQDYQGTSVTVEVARKLNVPRLMIVVNKTPRVYDFEQVRAQVAKLYHADVAAVLPHSDELMALASAGVFAVKHPDHPVTALYAQIANQVIA
ncbi:MAG: MinD/ParA family protein [Chloroflexi bacterium]|nr:MAG: MinD/ParA family protein [Chloroflexota bacterium]